MWRLPQCGLFAVAAVWLPGYVCLLTELLFCWSCFVLPQAQLVGWLPLGLFGCRGGSLDYVCEV